jgi:predicted DCC family thiol-disulfide oxidoreductase YuxK
MYDGECPFCKNYVHFIRLRDVLGHVDLINARDDTAERKTVIDKGFNIDDGMVLYYNQVYYHGHDAIHIIATLTDETGVINQLNKWIFSSPWRAKTFYPTLRCCRNLVLRIKNTKKIKDTL